MLNFYGKKIILGSTSPRRKELLSIIINEFDISAPHYQENNNIASVPEKICILHAYNKARSLIEKHPDAWIISADTIVVKNGKILGKPANEKDAYNMLKNLSGDKHFVYTAYCILNSNNGKYIQGIEKTEVIFRKIDDNLINFYIKNYTPYDKAGSYGIQDFSAVFIDKINGCFFNVVGFPIPNFYHNVRKNLIRCL
ncbi:MAG: septum formation protein Maf [Candidatus Marinimicrobia bacterium]|nr:septum formation protein Maf [Candidatus Neomarinimicrobiota bacterium]